MVYTRGDPTDRCDIKFGFDGEGAGYLPSELEFVASKCIHNTEEDLAVFQQIRLTCIFSFRLRQFALAFSNDVGCRSLQIDINHISIRLSLYCRFKLGSIYVLWE